MDQMKLSESTMLILNRSDIMSFGVYAYFAVESDFSVPYYANINLVGLLFIHSTSRSTHLMGFYNWAIGHLLQGIHSSNTLRLLHDLFQCVGVSLGPLQFEFTSLSLLQRIKKERTPPCDFFRLAFHMGKDSETKVCTRPQAVWCIFCQGSQGEPKMDSKSTT